MKTIFVTGGAGFIGSAMVRFLINHTNCRVVNIDKLTYAGNLASLASVSERSRYHFEQVDICASGQILDLFCKYQPDAVLHFAAESHVDRSIDRPAAFIETNIIGTYTLLEVARQYYCSLSGSKKSGFRFLHVSTDEVFGDLVENAKLFYELTAYAPSSPYSASKASADHLVRAWHRTYGLPVLITNCSNNYGYFQFPEKLIPLTILNALHGEPISIYGKGDQISENFKRLLGNGSDFGIQLSYAVQPKPEGLAQAFLIGEQFIGNDSVGLVLGDNIFYGQAFTPMLRAAANQQSGARICVVRHRYAR